MDLEATLCCTFTTYHHLVIFKLEDIILHFMESIILMVTAGTFTTTEGVITLIHQMQSTLHKEEGLESLEPFLVYAVAAVLLDAFCLEKS